MSRSLAVLASLLAAASFAAADPPAVPEKLDARPGELSRFVVKADKGKKVAFAPAFDDADCFVDRLYSDDPDAIRFLVQPHKGGTYVITFWTVGEGAYKQIRIQAGDPAPVVPPKPPGPPPPDGAYGLRKASRDGAAAVPASADKATQAKALAAASRATAAAVQAGQANDPVAGFDPEVALGKWRDANNAAVKGGGAWGPWASAVSDAFKTAYKANKLPGQAEWAAAFTEVAAGLEDN